MEWNKTPYADEIGIKVSSSTILALVNELLDETRTSTDWEVVNNVYKSLDDLLSISDFEVCFLYFKKYSNFAFPMKIQSFSLTLTFFRFFFLIKNR